MTHNTVVIALAGKGGVGKTSLSAAIVRLLTEKRPDAKILAIDADPAVGLSVALGVEVTETLDQIRKRVAEDVTGKLKDTQDILDIIDEKSQEMDVELTEDQKQQIADLMEKINGLDLNINDVKKQASEIYDRLSEIDVDGQGIFEKISTALRSFFGAIRELVK